MQLELGGGGGAAAVDPHKETTSHVYSTYMSSLQSGRHLQHHGAEQRGQVDAAAAVQPLRQEERREPGQLPDGTAENF